MLRDVTKQTDEGNYTCSATNEAGSSNAIAILNVDGKFLEMRHSAQKLGIDVISAMLSPLGH